MDISALKLFYTGINQIIVQQYKLAEATGANFNIFRILGLESAEVRTHSALLAELLNVKGSHGQGDRYLRLFTDRFSIRHFHTPSATTEIEKYIGGISSDYENGGRIDIAITDKDGRQILVENKIYATDQEKQLLRYHRFNPHAHLLYLTLDGLSPSELSTGKSLSPENVHSISYKNDIVDWLEVCHKESASKPLVRETLSQYIALIKHLTDQIENTGMSSEIRSFIISNPELLESIESCSKELEGIKTTVRDAFFSKMNTRFTSGEIARLGDVAIVAKWGEDGDGVHIGFQAFHEDKNVSSSPEVASHVVALKTINSAFRSGGEWLGWINPDPFRHRERFIHMTSKNLVAMYRDDGLLDALVDKIITQEKVIRDNFVTSLR